MLKLNGWSGFWLAIILFAVWRIIQEVRGKSDD